MGGKLKKRQNHVLSFQEPRHMLNRHLEKQKHERQSELNRNFLNNLVDYY